MNYLFVQTRHEHPSVYLGVFDNYSAAEHEAQKYIHRNEFMLSIFPIQVNPNAQPVGFNAVALCKEGFVEQSQNQIDYYTTCAGLEADKLPREQALTALQRSIDFFTKEVKRLEGLVLPELPKEVAR